MPFESQTTGTAAPPRKLDVGVLFSERGGSTGCACDGVGYEMRLWTVLWGGGGREYVVEVWEGLLDGWIGR